MNSYTYSILLFNNSKVCTHFISLREKTMENDFKNIFTLAAKHFFKDFKLGGGSQKKIAQRLGITNSYVSAVINGSKTASLTLLEQIAFMLSGKPLDEFLSVSDAKLIHRLPLAPMRA